MGFSHTPPGSQSNPIEGLPSSNFTDSQHTFILSGSPAYQSLPSRPSQPGITFVSTIECVREPVLLHSLAPGPYPGQPAVTRETLTAPPTYIAFCKYVFYNGLKEVGVYEIADALGYLKERGKPISKAVRNWKPLYDAIDRLMRDGVITRIDRGRYEVNFEACVRYANAVPKAIGNRDYVALRGHSVIGLPRHWADVILQRRYYEQALIDATQGTSPTWPAQAIYPIARLATPSGHRPLAIDLPDRYLLPSRALLHRSTVYCVHLGPKKVCSATPGQLYSYLAQLSPSVSYPAPAGPSRVVGPLADYERHLIPLSELPRRARKYELGYQVYDPFLFDFHQHFNVEVKGSQGLIYVTFKSKHEVTGDVVAKVVTSLPVIAGYYLDLLEQALYAIADHGMSRLGLTTPALMARSDPVLEEALYRRPKPRPAKGPVSLLVTEVRYRRNGQANSLRRDLSLSEFTAFLGELVDFSPFRLTYLEFTVAIPDRIGHALRLLGAGFLFIYHNPRKDPHGAVRVEFRPYRNVTRKVTPEDLNILFLGLAKALTVPISLAKLAWARAWLA